MAEDDTPNRGQDDTEDTPIVVPFHDPLPPPPEVHYTRPALGQKKSTAPGNQSSGPGSLGNWSPGAETGSHGAGLAAGTVFGVSIVAGALSGNWIDTHWLHAGTPWATLVMTLVGMAVGFINLQRILSRANRDQK